MTINGSVAVRGLPEEYDDWAHSATTAGASSRCCRTSYGLERDLDYAGPFHGKDGPLPIRRLPLETMPEPYRAFVAACKAQGFCE